MKNSVLALVEADGIFDGCQRIRLPIANDVTTFRKSLLVAVHVTPSIPGDIEIHIFDSKTQSFQSLTPNLLPTSSNCRLRLVIPPHHQQQKESATTKKSSSTKFPALPWREFDINLTDGTFLINGISLQINEVSNAGLGTGLNVWDGSIALAKYLESNPAIVEEKKILEVGAGTGLVGIAAAILGAKEVVVTDLEYSLANLRGNILLNQPSVDEKPPKRKILPIEAKVLDWFRPQDFDCCSSENCKTTWIPDVILASDVVWIDSLVLPLVKTLHYFCSLAVTKQTSPPWIIMSYQRRSQVVEDHLFQALRDHGFKITCSPKEETRSQVIQIFRIAFEGTVLS
ncbi:methyltransferase-16 family protein [Nitzschia inconspicua]|uniref:Methyltransferase-16 family protein n=1 Tax=Nitzschia inconspicua TaxID=303405 RepID=A0A9K3LF74_9STRA|nr:methyltransferase-16 family protein [Nitzschia inconspicua]